MTIRKETIRKLLQELASEYDIKIRFTESLNGDGEARFWNNSISISTKQSPRGMLSTFFHEAGHVYCWDKSLWKSYHIDKPIENLTPQERTNYLKTALRAERWVDNWAKKEMRKHFPDIKYIDGYLSKQDGEILKKSIRKLLKYE